MFTTLIATLLIQIAEPHPATLNDPARPGLNKSAAATPVILAATALPSAGAQETTRSADAMPGEASDFDPDAALAGINANLNAIDTLRARFIQINPTGRSIAGLLSLARPGRLRFEYDDPSPITVISDGTTVALEDSALETVDRAPIRSTPLWWLLKDEIDIASDGEIVEILEEYGLIYITLRDPNADVDGQIQFVFDSADYSLREWFVTDALGDMTRIILEDQEVGVELSPRLFIIPEPESDRNSRRGRR